MSTPDHSVQVRLKQDTHLFKSFSLSTRARVLASISAAFRQEVVFVGAVVAEHYTRRSKVEDGHAGTNGRVGTIPVADDRLICSVVMLLVQGGLLRHCCRGCCRDWSVRLWAMEEGFHLRQEQEVPSEWCSLHCSLAIPLWEPVYDYTLNARELTQVLGRSPNLISTSAVPRPTRSSMSGTVLQFAFPSIPTMRPNVYGRQELQASLTGGWNRYHCK